MIDQWTSELFWKSKCDRLNISDTLSSMECGGNKTDESTRKKQLNRRGFCLVDEELPSGLIGKLRKGVEDLAKQNLPASCIILFDECWQLAQCSESILKGAGTVASHFHHDILAWYIDGAGFSPHRDRQPDDVKSSFSNEGDAKFVTHWIALTDATPTNSCLYMIPRQHDPGYIDGDKEDEDALQVALPDKYAYQHIQAIPRESGQSVLFTHRVIHWGSAQDEGCKEARIALSFVQADPSFEKPYVNTKYFESMCPPFRIRLLLLCSQLLIYHERFHLSTECLQLCYRYCKDNETELEESYLTKVFYEFVKAVEEKKEDDGHGSDEEADEAMLEAMLDANEEFHDDFDDCGLAGEVDSAEHDEESPKRQKTR